MSEIKDYLKSIHSVSGKAKYKRISLSPLRYAGGKSKAVGLILENFPTLREKKVVSPFFGGGSLELALTQQLGFEVVGYDIFGMLTNFWDTLIKQPEQLAVALEQMSVTKDSFTRYRHILLHYWDKIKPASLVYNTKKKIELTTEEKSLLDDDNLMQAAYYYYNMALSYGPMFLGWPSSNEINPAKFKRRIAKIRAFKPGKLSVSCASFEEAISNHKEDFLFLDPPYYLGEDSKMFKGMYPNCNFAIHHNGFDHKKLCTLLKEHKGGFLLTYNNCPTIRDWYKDFQQEFPSWQYTYGQGEKRIGKNRQQGTNNHIKESHEIFIISPPSE